MLKHRKLFTNWNLRFICNLLLLICCLLVYIYPAFSQEAGGIKKAVIIIAQEGFRDEELFQTKAILEKNGIEVELASLTLSPAKGMLGASVKPDLSLRDINPRDFAAIIFVGGIGASQYWDNPVALQLVQEAANNDKIVAAICLGPVTLARAGVLRGKRATVFYSQAEELKVQGADYTGNPVEKDTNIITGDGPGATREFAEQIVRAILY